MLKGLRELRKKVYRASVARTRKSIKKEKRFIWMFLIRLAVFMTAFGIIAFNLFKRDYNELYDVIAPQYDKYLDKTVTQMVSRDQYFEGGESYLDLSHSTPDDCWRMSFGAIRLTMSTICQGTPSHYQVFDRKTGDILFASESTKYILRVNYGLYATSSVSLFYELNEKQNDLVAEIRKGVDVRLSGGPYFVSGYFKGTEVVLEKYYLYPNGEVFTADLSGIDVSDYEHIEVSPESSGSAWSKTQPEGNYFGKDGNYEISVYSFWDISSESDEESKNILLSKIDSADDYVEGVHERTFESLFSRRVTMAEFGTYENDYSYVAGWSYVIYQDKMTVIMGILQAAVLWLAASFLAAWILASIDYRRHRIRHEIYTYRTTLTDTLAHDLKTPLMDISGYAENLEMGVNPEKQGHYIHEIRGQVDYMNGLISGILELSKAENEDSFKKEIDIKEMTAGLIKEYESPASQKDLKITLLGEGKVSCAESSLESIIRNLIDNAIKFAPEKDEVIVNISGSSFSVENTLDPASSLSKEEIVKPFVKGDAARSGRTGYGLGLSIVKNICETAGYKFVIETDEGKFVAKIDF